MPELGSSQMGETARRLLTPGARGRVLAGFSRAAYLVTEREELFWLTPESAPMHPRGLRIIDPFPRLVAGERFFVEGERINITPHLQVDFSEAYPWAKPRLSIAVAVDTENIAQRITGILKTSPDTSKATGFGRLIPGILRLADGQPDAETEIDPILRRAWPAVRAIASACLRRDTAGIWNQTDSLVGLGEGLTPSGDDFLGGLLFCSGALRGVIPGLADQDSSQPARFLESAKWRTNQISFTLLEDLAGGQAVEPLHDFVYSILSGQAGESLASVSRLTRIGHSTGWDLLTGALTGFLLTLRSHELADSLAELSKKYAHV